MKWACLFDRVWGMHCNTPTSEQRTYRPPDPTGRGHRMPELHQRLYVCSHCGAEKWKTFEVVYEW